MKTLLILSTMLYMTENPSINVAKPTSFNGFAKEVSTHKLLYEEVHTEIYSADKHNKTETKFLDENKKIIASRILDFSNSMISPQYSLEDHRTGAYEAVTNRSGKFLIQYKENRDAETISESITVPDPAVVDGGFNYFVKSKWNQLMQGETVGFNYISTARQEYYRFQLTIDKSSSNRSSNLVLVKMEPTNYFLRALLDPIYITYNKNTRRIVQYSGISNIKDKEGKTQVAVLTYPTVGP
ncbi:MAG: hypothetical protein PHU27_12700 [Salinivirgaceae bacterium]|nr:hypothetical protein [Salinivirgaceae bacterium]MDY0281922.1 hypothetical protein [Salinivirgaceae bacterium]